MSNDLNDVVRDQQKAASSGSLYTALAHTGTRTLALYFSRPVRLFRPSKLSGWQTLKALAVQNGSSLSPQYMLWLIRNQATVLPKHFLPPIFVNACLGTVLWTSYAEVSELLESHVGQHPTLVTMIAGGTAGAMQAVAAAPVENVRMVIEGGTSQIGWSHAWKEVFLRSEYANQSIKSNLQKAKEVRVWTRDVREMAGRGWEGWGWGVAKDSCGFAVFFAVFDITRRLAARTKGASELAVSYLPEKDNTSQKVKHHMPRTVYSITLVAGGAAAGLAYEAVTRPWDAARKAVRLEQIASSDAAKKRFPILRSLKRIVENEGWIGFFRDPDQLVKTTNLNSAEKWRQRLFTTARVLARVGPWGIGFLVWETLS